MNKLRLGLYGTMCAGIGLLVTLIIDVALALLEREMPMALFPALVLVVYCVLFFLIPRSFKRLSIMLLAIFGSLLICFVALYSGLDHFQDTADYRDADADGGAKAFFADRRIMLIVPHQDDDLNVMGGTIEEYLRYGSEVYVVYLTNGDMTPAEIRYAEAIACLSKLGIPEEHVIFLGYGDRWKEGGPHLYNAEPGRIMESRAGFYATYGTTDHPSYHEGTDYTIENLLADMESVILEYRPDTIFCCDYDEHPDHKATSLVFEKAMGNILKEYTDYQPCVFKGFAYRTAWNNVFDYYSLNMKSTQEESMPVADPMVEYYRWENRIRFPVDASGLSRSLLGSRSYEVLNTYVSQNVYQKAQSMINGDKVFWERMTTSLCNRAEISASSGRVDLLNDFMLLENNNLADDACMPYDGVWIPTSEDPEKQLFVQFPEKTDVASIVLYDHPSPEQNVKQLAITFDNGETVTCGPLDPIGSPTTVMVDQKQISSFAVELVAAEGAEAGLTEIEAFADFWSHREGFIQLMDSNREFVYDYITTPSGDLVLQLYSYGDVPQIGPEHYTVFSDNEQCKVNWSGQELVVSCPVGEAATISVVSEETGLWDRVFVQNPGLMDRMRIWALQRMELFGLELPENHEKEALLQHLVIRRFQVKLWNLYYRLTH